MARDIEYNTRASVEAYIREVQGHDSRQVIRRLERCLPRGSCLLEIGSGPGTDWKILCRRFRVTGSDLSRAFLNHLRKRIRCGILRACVEPPNN